MDSRKLVLYFKYELLLNNGRLTARVVVEAA